MSSISIMLIVLWICRALRAFREGRRSRWSLGQMSLPSPEKRQRKSYRAVAVLTSQVKMGWLVGSRQDGRARLSMGGAATTLTPDTRRRRGDYQIAQTSVYISDPRVRSSDVYRPTYGRVRCDGRGYGQTMDVTQRGNNDHVYPVTD